MLSGGSGKQKERLHQCSAGLLSISASETTWWTELRLNFICIRSLVPSWSLVPPCVLGDKTKSEAHLYLP